MTDFRALCVELVDDLELSDWPYKLKETFRADIDRARAALAQPEPQGPTDGELCETYRTAYYAEPNRQGPHCQAAALRAVLKRWGE
jgi:hypothetical protein